MEDRLPFQPSRPRRNRRNAAIRGLARETRLHPEQLIYPLFCVDGQGVEDPIATLPGMARLSEDKLLAEIERSWNLGIRNFCLFPAVEEHLKDKTASHSWADDNFYLRIARNVKERFPECSLMSDVAMDPYSSDGHDGVVTEDGRIDNEATLPILARMSVAQAQAGFDWIGPSDMMDGRIGVIREALDENGYNETGILAYTAKYASVRSTGRFGMRLTVPPSPATRRPTKWIPPTWPRRCASSSSTKWRAPTLSW